MGLRFQRRIKVLPGLRINLSKSGVGFSVGGRGAHIGITARGQRYTSIGMPGTGLSWREYARRLATDQTRYSPVGFWRFIMSSVNWLGGRKGIRPHQGRLGKAPGRR